MNNKQRKQLQDAIDQNIRRRKRNIRRGLTSDDINVMATPVQQVSNTQASNVYRECKG